MTYDEFLLCLDLLPGFGPYKFKNLVDAFGGREELFEAWQQKKIPGLKLSDTLISQGKSFKAKLRDLGVNYVSFGDPEYPANLQVIADPPLVIYYIGEIDKLDSAKSISIVGSRKTTKQGEQFTADLCTELVGAGYQIISGMAFGIDGFAHKAVLESGGFTAAVLPANPHIPTPATHQYLYNQIREKGLVLSENILKEVVPGMFASRNRLIAGLSLATVVIEAGEKSGSLITANCAFNYARELFAVPGAPNNLYSQGCNLLIKQNKAKLIESAEDILVEIDPTYSPKSLKFNFSTISEMDKKILNLLSGRSLSLDQICQAVDMSPSNAISYLSALEISGVVFQDSNFNYSVR